MPIDRRLTTVSRTDTLYRLTFYSEKELHRGKRLFVVCLFGAIKLLILNNLSQIYCSLDTLTHLPSELWSLLDRLG